MKNNNITKLNLIVLNVDNNEKKFYSIPYILETLAAWLWSHCSSSAVLQYPFSDACQCIQTKHCKQRKKIYIPSVYDKFSWSLHYATQHNLLHNAKINTWGWWLLGDDATTGWTTISTQLILIKAETLWNIIHRCGVWIFKEIRTSCRMKRVFGSSAVNVDESNLRYRNYKLK